MAGSGAWRIQPVYTSNVALQAAGAPTSHLDTEAARMDERRETEENAAMALKRKSEKLAARADESIARSGS